MGRSLVMTCFEERSLTEKLEACGGRTMGPVLHIPAVSDTSALPVSAVSEWYAFTGEMPQVKLASFIRSTWFTLGPAAVARVQPENRWDLQRTVRLFWQELQRLQPESYVARGQRLLIVTRNQTHFTTILRAFSGPLKNRAGDLTA
ncbi:MAG TPA: hypothetical protein VE783_11850 [Candidatus Limnocylindrales bacterium]|nr:hypothetical protein [Candidatus Limnocylindrales bacterium]